VAFLFQKESMNFKISLATVMAVLLSACQSYTAQTYSISPDTVRSVKNLKLNESVGVGDVLTPVDVDLNCRAMGPIALPNKLTLSTYVKKAMEDELKIGDAYAYQNPKVVLSAQITKFSMSSSKGLTRGYFDIDLKVTSSNGKFIQANEYYEFDSGFDGYTACKNTSDALMPAVQNLVAKVYKSPQFIDLVKTSNK
jgi:hypothetical protein